MKDQFGMDAEFLAQPFDYVGAPLVDVPRAQNVLFAPGTGLGLGDQFLCLPLLQRLRRHCPGASIHLWTDFTEFWDMVADPCVHVVPVPHDQPHGLVDFVRRTSFDLVVAGFYPGCLHDLAFATCPTVFCAGTDLGHYRAFYAYRGLCREIPLTNLHRCVNEQHRFLGLFDDFGLYKDTIGPLTFRDRQYRPSGRVAQPTILVHPGTAKPYKQWPAAHWRCLVKYLADCGSTIAVSGGVSQADQQLARDVQGNDRRVAVLPPMRLKNFLEYMSTADIVLSADTFIPHAAAWLGAPHTLTLYGPTDPLRFCPASANSLFLSPLDINPVDVATAVNTMIAIRTQGPAAVALPGSSDALLQAANALIQFVATSTVGYTPPPQPAAQWRQLINAYRDRIQPQHRRLLVGDDAMLERCERFAGTTPWNGAVDFLRAAAASRGAMLVTQCRDRMSLAGAMAS